MRNVLRHVINVRNDVIYVDCDTSSAESNAELVNDVVQLVERDLYTSRATFRTLATTRDTLAETNRTSIERPLVQRDVKYVAPNPQNAARDICNLVRDQIKTSATEYTSSSIKRALRQVTRSECVAKSGGYFLSGWNGASGWRGGRPCHSSSIVVDLPFVCAGVKAIDRTATIIAMANAASSRLSKSESDPSSDCSSL